jgi:hypothetical protein
MRNWLLVSRAGEGGGHDVKDIDRDREANVVEAAVSAAGAIARRLAWVHYQQLLSQFLRLMKRHAEANKVELRGLFVCLSSAWDAGAVGGPGGETPVLDLTEPRERADIAFNFINSISFG